MTAPTTLLINLGDLPSLTALALRRDLDQVVMWHPAGEPPGDGVAHLLASAVASHRLSCVHEQYEAYQTAKIVIARTISAMPMGQCDAQTTGHTMFDPLHAAALLVEAARTACMFDCRTIVWPARLGPYFDTTRPALDVISHVRGLLAIKTEPEGCSVSKVSRHAEQVTVEAPLLDLTCQQVVELADEQAAPWHLCWPFDEFAPNSVVAGTHSANAMLESRLDETSLAPWRKAFDELGLAWPWSNVDVCATA